MNIYNNISYFFQIAIIVAQGMAVIKKRNIEWKNNGNDSNGSLVSTISSSSSRALMCQMEDIKFKLTENIAEQVGTVIQDSITNEIIPYFSFINERMLDYRLFSCSDGERNKIISYLESIRNDELNSLLRSMRTKSTGSEESEGEVSSAKMPSSKLLRVKGLNYYYFKPAELCALYLGGDVDVLITQTSFHVIEMILLMACFSMKARDVSSAIIIPQVIRIEEVETMKCKLESGLFSHFHPVGERNIGVIGFLFFVCQIKDRFLMVVASPRIKDLKECVFQIEVLEGQSGPINSGHAFLIKNFVHDLLEERYSRMVTVSTTFQQFKTLSILNRCEKDSILPVMRNRRLSNFMLPEFELSGKSRVLDTFSVLYCTIRFIIESEFLAEQGDDEMSLRLREWSQKLVKSKKQHVFDMARVNDELLSMIVKRHIGEMSKIVGVEFCENLNCILMSCKKSNGEFFMNSFVLF